LKKSISFESPNKKGYEDEDEEIKITVKKGKNPK
jgi:hypothetical protein